MPNYHASAPGKVILFGEHAVVYGQPAIATPLHSVRTTAVIQETLSGNEMFIIAANLARTLRVTQLPIKGEHALCKAARLLSDHLGMMLPPMQIMLHSTIPVASGLGSGAAATAALMKVIALGMERDIPLSEINALVYQIEMIHHGTPSGIDNTVVVYEQPVFYVRGHEPGVFKPAVHCMLVVADTGVSSPTHHTVRDVRILYDSDPEKYGAIFEDIGALATQAQQAIINDDPVLLGALARENHALLRALTVSSDELDALVAAAESAGAYGAKLSGGGRGGHMIAFVAEEHAGRVSSALRRAGAKHVYQARLS